MAGFWMVMNPILSVILICYVSIGTYRILMYAMRDKW